MKRIRRAIDLLHFFYIQRVRGFEPPTDPHMGAETKAWLADQLRSAKLYLEFGCGGSTVLASRLQVRTVSVESDPYYAAAVRQVLPHPEVVDILTPRMGLTGEWGMPLFNKARKGRGYVRAPFAGLGRQFPDLVVVDGRYRVACALETARRAYLAGARPKLLVDDFAPRPEYHVLERYLGEPTLMNQAALFEPTADVPASVVDEFVEDPR